jgi:hypothetical protein
MPKYFGTTNNIIDWDPIVEICKNTNNGDFNSVTTVVDRSEAEAEGNLLNSYHDVINTWQNGGYNLDEIQWYDYYPGEHFDIDIQTKFAAMVNAEPLRVFVSEVHPGRNVPYHWDVEDKEQEWLAQGELKRWVCFIDKPRWGCVLILEDECFHNVEQGAVYEWDNYRSYHAGTCCGQYSQYLFHFLGRPNNG